MTAHLSFSERLLAWFDRHGRKDLPWQQSATPYRVWVSEIMLQQTQVSTVISYYQRFMARFPDVRALASAELDEVLHLWSGLGYYARARHLHAAAQHVCSVYDGVFPTDLEAMQTLPGVGRSTAAAILSLASGVAEPILDGNVKRVFARHAGIDGWPGDVAVQRRLWALAETRMSTTRPGPYNQALMDLGATLCTRAQPRCEQCPVRGDCVARLGARQSELPTPRPRRVQPLRSTTMLLVENAEGRILLEQRLPVGIWGGLWAPPECPPDWEPTAFCHERLGVVAAVIRELPGFRHTFSHFQLDIRALHLRTQGGSDRVMEGPERVWYNSRLPDARGLAAPVQRLLASLRDEP
ncbi:A/G-specific adenine glycosylase [Plasticicumulans acidivorans]|uniref:Adenine DNA glycosylase n=1 Tax=Plasticicumulans acidivorans TaxID=886464 RepID=A0A317MQN7_9GAMM|nr:A/G-specific adenine glycosylase [Plasticicumulans acidivorans]PWV58840.1 A/G-specific DNA-adenine glycosylase [Plasticicumulans acidivorans]